jgi:hypothetical protein
MELTDYCKRMNWDVVKVFTNKISGAAKNADREEILALVECARLGPKMRFPRSRSRLKRFNCATRGTVTFYKVF